MLFGGIGRQMLRFTRQMADAIKQGRLGVGGSKTMVPFSTRPSKVMTPPP
jgi:hypothetical protein